MVNEHLHQALRDAGIQPDQLADIVQVGDRSVRRWLAGGVPYARYRAKLARALDTTELALWPQLAKASRPAAVDAPAAVADTVDAYAHADLVDAPSTEQLIADAREQIDLLDHASADLLAQPGLCELLAAKAGGGCRVRVLVCEPDQQSLGPLLGAPGIEIRLTEIPERPFSHRADDHTLAWFEFLSDEDHPAAMLLHVARDTAPGLFTRLAERYQELWESGEPVQTVEDIDYHRLERELGSENQDEDEDEDEDDEQNEPDRQDGQAAVDSPSTPQPSASPVTPVAQPAATAPRRWPGRPE